MTSSVMYKTANSDNHVPEYVASNSAKTPKVWLIGSHANRTTTEIIQVVAHKKVFVAVTVLHMGLVMSFCWLF